MVHHCKYDGFFKAKLDWVVIWISRLEGERGGWGVHTTTIINVVSWSQYISMIGRVSCKVCHDIRSSSRSLSLVIL